MLVLAAACVAARPRLPRWSCPRSARSPAPWSAPPAPRRRGATPLTLRVCGELRARCRRWSIAAAPGRRASRCPSSRSRSPACRGAAGDSTRRGAAGGCLQTARMEYTATAFARSVQARLPVLLPAGQAARRSTSTPSRASSSGASRYEQPRPLALRGVALPAGARDAPAAVVGRVQRLQSGQREPRTWPTSSSRSSSCSWCCDDRDVRAGACSRCCVVAAGAPLLVGVLRTLKARLVGPARAARAPALRRPRQAPRARRPSSRTTTSWIFRVTPYVLVADHARGGRSSCRSLLARPVLDFAGLVLAHVPLRPRHLLPGARRASTRAARSAAWGRAARSRWPRWPSRRS